MIGDKLYNVSVDGKTLPVYGRVEIPALSLIALINNGLQRKQGDGVMYSDYYMGLTEAFVTNEFIYINGSREKIVERQRAFGMRHGEPVTKFVYENGSELSFTDMDHLTGSPRLIVSIGQVHHHWEKTIEEAENARKLKEVCMRKPEADIEIEENEMPKVVIRYLGYKTFTKLVEYFKESLRLKFEGNNQYIQMEDGWELLVDGMYIVQYQDGVMESFTESEFREAYCEHSTWQFDEFGAARSVANKDGLRVFGAVITMRDKKELEETLSAVPNNIVATNRAEEVTGPAAWLNTTADKLRYLYLGKEEEVKVDKEKYMVSQYGNEINGYNILRKSDSSIVATVYSLSLANQMVMGLNDKSDREMAATEKVKVEKEKITKELKVNESFWRGLSDVGRIHFLNEKLVEGTNMDRLIGVQLLLGKPDKEVYLMSDKIEGLHGKVVVTHLPKTNEYEIKMAELDANDNIFDGEEKEQSIIEAINQSESTITIHADQIDMKKCAEKVGAIVTSTASGIVATVKNNINKSEIAQKNDGSISLKVEGPGARINLDGGAKFIKGSNIRPAFVLRNHFEMFKYRLDAGAKQLENPAAIQMEIVNMLIEASRGKHMTDFRFLNIPVFGTNMTFNVTNGKEEFIIEVGTTTHENKEYTFKYYLVMK